MTIRLTTISEVAWRASRLPLCAVAGIAFGTNLAGVIICEEVCHIAQSAVVLLCTCHLLNQLAVRAFSFIWFARRAGILRATLRVMTGTANGALGRTSDTVSGVGTALVTRVVATRRVVSTVAYPLCARTIAPIPCWARRACCACQLRAT